jgi:hypothetical protein
MKIRHFVHQPQFLSFKSIRKSTRRLALRKLATPAISVPLLSGLTILDAILVWERDPLQPAALTPPRLRGQTFHQEGDAGIYAARFRIT